MGCCWSCQSDPALRSHGKRKSSRRLSCSSHTESFMSCVTEPELKHHTDILCRPAKRISSYNTRCVCSPSQCSLCLVALPNDFFESSDKNMNYMLFGEVGIALDIDNRASDITIEGSECGKYTRKTRPNVGDQNFIGYRLECCCSVSKCWLVIFALSTDVQAKGENKIDNKNSISSRDVRVAFDCIQRAEEIVMEGDERRRALRKKWLYVEHPNLIMFRASMEMLCYAWYWGNISRVEAQRQLTGKKDGTFLVRDSEMNGEQFTLSFRMCNRTLHYRIQYHDDFWHFEARSCKSIVEIVENIRNQTIYVQRANDLMPPFPVILIYPLSRYANFPKLQDLCRRVIQRNTSNENIQMLPLPNQMKQFLNQKAGNEI